MNVEKNIIWLIKFFKRLLEKRVLEYYILASSGYFLYHIDFISININYTNF